MKHTLFIICKGVPASGKTTWAKEFIQEKIKQGDYSWVRVNRDDLRRSTGVEYHFKNESLISSIEEAAVVNALLCGKNVISDNTNLNEDRVNELLRAVEGIDRVDIIHKEFKISFEEALKRDAAREHSVGKKVLRNFYGKYYPGYMDKVDPRLEGNTFIYNPELSDCIICDIDGTISLMNGRNPFKGEDCASDLPNTPVIRLLQDTKKLNDWHNSEHANFEEWTSSTEIILFSGRNGESEEQTKKWLRDHNVPYDQLHMREPKNQEKDSNLKLRFFEQHVAGKYNVKFVLDDRDQVVKTWRDLGLPCFQVFYGTF